MVEFTYCEGNNNRFFPEAAGDLSLNVIKAEEAGKELGACLFSINYENNSVTLIKVTKNNIDMIQEGLIRSVLNYAANRGIYMAYIKSDSDFNKQIIYRMRFELKNDLFSCDIPTALQGSCCK